MALEGNTHHEIAEKLGIMPDAARKRLGEIYKKFDLTGRGSGKLAKLQQRLLAEYQNQRQSQIKPVNSIPNQSSDLMASPNAWASPPQCTQFYGREGDIEQLQSKVLKDKILLIAILGLKGIGKTALVNEVVEYIKDQDQFDFVLWRSLDTPSIQTFIAIIDGFITHVRNKPLSQEEDHLEALMDCFREYRCLLILDGLDALFLPFHEDSSDQKLRDQELLGDLLRRVGTERHQSCLMLTSQEKPKEVEELERLNYPVFSLFLGGLDPKDAKKLLQAHELVDKSDWPDLIKLFQGNPLALQMISVPISRFFGGHVSEFMAQETMHATHINELLAHQFKFLSELEEKVLKHLAETENAHSFSTLKEKLDCRGAELLSALESLVRRSLLKGDNLFELQPIVKKYIIHYVIAKEKDKTLAEKQSRNPSPA